MTRAMMLAGLVVGSAALAGCASDYGRYGYYGGYDYGYSRPSYSRSYYPSSYGWYDGYYGRVHSGYWGQGGIYYYRTHERDRWRRDDGRHFRRGDGPGGNWQRWDRDDRDHHRDHDRRRGRGHRDRD